MMTLDFSRCRLPPFQHQREDVAWLLERPWALVANEMRTGKSKTVIDAAQFLFLNGNIKRVIVIAPAPVRDVWFDNRLGELAKHLWLPASVTVFHSSIKTWLHGEGGPRLDWYISNFEFIRSSKKPERGGKWTGRVAELLPLCGPDTLLIGDESSFIKNHAAAQTIAFAALRRACGRVWLLNGTPVFHSPLDLFSQGNILHPDILQCPYIGQFKARYAVQDAVLSAGGKPLTAVGRGGKVITIQKISSWTNLEDLRRRFAPITVRRLQADCLDLPPKLDPVMLTATMTPATWKAYKQMRDEMVVWLNESTVATSATAAVKAMRLSQITSGFLGGVEDAGVETDDDLLESVMIPGVTHDIDGEPWGESPLEGVRRTLEEHGSSIVRHNAEGVLALGRATEADPRDVVGDLGGTKGVQEIGREKLDILLWFIEQQLEADPNLKLVAWSRFRAAVFRAVAAVKEKFPQFEVAAIMGSQKRVERLRALALLKPETSPEGPVFVCGIQGTGSFGLDFTAAHTCVTMSTGYSPGRSAQTLDRVYGPGMTHPVAYYNIIACGPKGQHTIDRDILIALANGEDVATRTANAWVRALQDE